MMYFVFKMIIQMGRHLFQHGFHAADTDHSGHIDLPEFKHLISFIVWLNEQRHLVPAPENISA